MNRPRLRLVAAAVAATLMLSVTGCATAIDGTATAASNVEALAPSDTADAGATDTEAADPNQTASGEAPAPQTLIPPIDPTALEPADPATGATDPGAGGTVDEAGAAWLTGFCVGFADVSQYAAPDTTGMSVDAALQTIVDAYTGMAQAAGEAAANLQAMPQPTFPGADVMAPAINAWLLAVNAVYSAGASTIASTTFTSEDELAATINTIESGMSAPNDTISSALAGMDPSVRATITTLPECQGLMATG